VLSDDIRDLKVMFRQKNPKSAGVDGELCAEGWLKRQGWDFTKIDDQARGTMSRKLKAHCGKRPDFLAMDPKDGAVLALDAKHVNTANSQTFTLTKEELAKYIGLENFIKSEGDFPAVVVVFMVIPKESRLTRMVLVRLDDFETAQSTQLGGEPALSVSLLDRDSLWTDIDPNDALQFNKGVNKGV
jgi:hypothetical protein